MTKNQSDTGPEVIPEPKDLGNSYKISIVVRHPDIDPTQISKELDLPPHVAFKAGSVRVLPNGNTLPGLATESRWSYICDLSNDARLSRSIEEIVTFLELHAAFLRKLCLQGGTVELYIQLPGDLNIGDAISWELMKKMAQLRISLGVEVFPKRPDGQQDRATGYNDV